MIQTIDPYVIQRAQESLKVLLGDEPHKGRIEQAFELLAFVTSDHFARTCPPRVQDALKRVASCEHSPSTQDKADSLYLAIQEIFMALGKQDAVLQVEELDDLKRIGHQRQQGQN